MKTLTGALVGAGLLAACSLDSSEPDASSHGQTRQRVVTGTPSLLAYPEYDLNDPIGFWYMDVANEATIRAKITEGFRLSNLEVVQASPALFSATFVHNAGVYQKTGNDLATDLTEAQILAIYGDSSRRIVDFAQYEVAGSQRYAAVWIDNTGTQQKTYQLVLNQLELALPGYAGSWRIVDLEPAPPLDCDGVAPPCVPLRKASALMIENVGADARTQQVATRTKETFVSFMDGNRGCGAEAGQTPCRRFVDAFPIPGESNFFLTLTEDVYSSTNSRGYNQLDSGELGFWAGQAFYQAGDFAHPDSMEHLTRRLGARFTRLVPHAVGGETRYLAALASAGTVPGCGTSDEINPVLQAVDEVVCRQLRRNGLPGLVLGITQGGRLVQAKGYGYSDVASARVATPTDSFRVASVSKAIAKAAIMRMVQDALVLPGDLPGAGKTFSLETKPWGDVIPYPPAGHPTVAGLPSLADITVGDLLTHQTGLRDTGTDLFDPNCVAGTWVQGCDHFGGLIDLVDYVAKEAEFLQTLLDADPENDSPPFYQTVADAACAILDAASQPVYCDRGNPQPDCCPHPADNDTSPACSQSLIDCRDDPTCVHPAKAACTEASAEGFYRNAHYHMLARVIDEVSGVSYNDYTRARLFDPLNLDRVRVSGRVQGGFDPACQSALPPFEEGIYQAKSVGVPEWLRNGGEPLSPGDWALCPAPRQAASNMMAAPPDILRWAVAVDQTRPAGYQVLNGTTWAQMAAMGGTDHNGSMDGTVAWLTSIDANPAAVPPIPERVSIFWAANSQGMDQDTLIWELMTLLGAQSAGLPTDDQFDDYIEPPCLQYFHGLPIASFQACFDHWTALGYQPTTLTVNPGATVISGAFHPAAPRATGVFMPAAEYDATTTAYEEASVYPLHVNFVTASDGLKATAMWQHTALPAYTDWDLLPATYEAKWHELVDTLGYIPTDVFGYQNSGLKFAGTWKKLPHDGLAAHNGMTEAQFAAENPVNEAAGLKLVHFVAYPNGGSTLLSAIWQRLPGEYVLTRDTSSAAYQLTAEARVAAGYLLHQLHSYDADSFAAIWHRPAPGAGPFSLDDPSQWTVVTGSGALTPGAIYTQGQGSISLGGDGFVEVISPVVTTEMVRKQTSGGNPRWAALDVYIPTGQPNPWWVGAIQIYIHIPSAGINHQFIAQRELTGLALGQYHRLLFDLPANVEAALLQNRSDVRFYISKNTPAGAPALLLDNLRFLP